MYPLLERKRWSTGVISTPIRALARTHFEVVTRPGKHQWSRGAHENLRAARRLVLGEE